MALRGDKLRAITATGLAEILSNGASLNRVLPNTLAQIPPDSRPLVQEMLFGSLRQGPLLDGYLELLLKKPLKQKDADVFALLLLGLYQLKFMRIAQHAVVNETVRAATCLKKGWAKPLVNGVLRQFNRQEEALFKKLDPAARSAHPQWLFDKIQQSWPNQAQSIIEANNSRPPLTLRVNHQENIRLDYLGILKAHRIDATVTPFSEDGITLSNPTAVEAIPGFLGGSVSVQDEAAQLAAFILNPTPKSSVLDLCAAPGGKACHLLERFQQIKKLVVVDISEDRLERVTENLQRLSLEAECRLGNATQTESWLKEDELFDHILVDAPCSGSGVIRRNPDIKWLRTSEDIEELSKQQLAILQAAWSALKPKGRLLYATCSIFPEENHLLMQQFLIQNSNAKAIPITASWGVSSGTGRQLFPSKNGHDGFFYALLTKT